jgi:ABC-type uncharacterized transport system ATPase subunit
VIIEASHVAKRFGRFDAIEDLSMRVPEGSAFVLEMPNATHYIFQSNQREVLDAIETFVAGL